MPTSSGFAALGVSAITASGRATINKSRRNNDVDFVTRMTVSFESLISGWTSILLHEAIEPSCLRRKDTVQIEDQIGRIAQERANRPSASWNDGRVGNDAGIK